MNTGFFSSLAESLSDTLFGGQDPFQMASRHAASAFQQAMDPQGGGNRGAPPTATKTLRQLPIVTVSPEDLVDENNRECCICLEENQLKDRVIRLPCAHIFHQKCIVDWLTQHCTCPVCRYELPTDDPDYERSRKERMRHRKPRIRMYELERMPLHELKSMSKEYKIPWPQKVREKKDILEAFVNSGRIEIIAAPEPIEYSLKELRLMGVSELKRAMEKAGVFFDPIDVVEKEDMVQIFCNSGRVILRQDPTDETGGECPDVNMLEEENEQAMEIEPIDIHSRYLVETVTDDDSDDTKSKKNKNAIEMFNAVEKSSENTPENASLIPDDMEDLHVGADTFPTQIAMSETTIPRNSDQESQEGAQQFEHHNDNNDSSPIEEINEEILLDDSDQIMMDNKIASVFQHYESLSIAGLRQAARENSVDLSQCIERSEMVEKLVRADCQQGLLEEDFDQWSVSDIRALATAIQVDLNDCSDRMSMLHKILAETSLHPHVARYTRSLMPLAILSVPQLRSVAREWQVNVSNCIEKEEIFHRLVSATTIPASLH